MKLLNFPQNGFYILLQIKRNNSFKLQHFSWLHFKAATSSYTFFRPAYIVHSQLAAQVFCSFFFVVCIATAALTVGFVADGALETLLALRGFPEAIGVLVNTRADAGIRRPATEHSVTVVSPVVVVPILNPKQKKNLTEELYKGWVKVKGLLRVTYIFTKKANPHGFLGTVHVHAEGGLY